MGFRLSIKGMNDSILLEKESIVEVKYLSDTPNDSNARATDLSTSLQIKGKIIAGLNDDNEDNTRKLAMWSLVPSESSDAYRDIFVEIISAGKTIRKINMPHAFVIDYEEEYSDSTGNGAFKIRLKQKKEKVKDVSIDGGYANGE